VQLEGFPYSTRNKEIVAETAAKAKELLFDKEGKPRRREHYLVLLTFHTVLRKAL
jgi:hypothetical protein